jgi:hypothetical protein
MTIAGHSLHGSQREGLPQWALALESNKNMRWRQPALDRPTRSVPEYVAVLASLDARARRRIFVYGG